jgi:F-box protein 39
VIYIDSGVEHKEPEDENHVYSQWNVLPDVVLEKIFGYLDIKERYYAALVCANWAYMFHSPRVWRNFILDDLTLTRRKFNFYMGYQVI